MWLLKFLEIDLLKIFSNDAQSIRQRLQEKQKFENSISVCNLPIVEWVQAGILPAIMEI